MDVFHVIVTLAVVVCAVVGMVVLRSPPDITLLGGLTVLLVLGVVDTKSALAGFANEGLITVGVLFVVSAGLNQTGAMATVGQTLLGSPKSITSAQARIIFPAATLSAFLNNTPVVATLLPIIADWAKKNRLSVSHLFLPLSYAAILGGMCTLVGTSTTLVVNGLLIEQNGVGLGMFDIAWIGVPATLIGLAYLIVCTRWLLPERVPAIQQLDDPREYTVEMLVDPSSPLVGKTIEDAGLRHLPGMYLMEIDRDGHILPAVSSSALLRANDRLVFVGVVESVIDLQRIPGLQPATNQVFKLDAPRSERCLIEAVVSDSCPSSGLTIREAKFRTRYNAAVIAVSRNGVRIDKKIGDIQLQAGDTLLLEAHPSFADVHRNSRDFFLLSRVEGSTPPRHEKAWIARLILAGMVGVVASGYSMLEAACVAAGLMVATRCCRGSQARAAVDWSVLLTIGAGLGLGKAMEQSGAARLLAQEVITMVGSHPQIVLAIVYSLTMIFTNLITAKAAAVLFFPIAIEAAEQLQVSNTPFAIAVMVSAAASFATPIGYQTNLMVLGPGGYRSSDYLKIGGILSILIAVLAISLIPIVWPF